MKVMWKISTSPFEDGRQVYAVEDQGADEAIPLHNGYLLIRKRDELNVSFALLEFDTGPVSGDTGSKTLYRMIMHGEGPSGNLRECRHTWWGEGDNAGYIFYPNFELISAALRELARWFDGTCA